MDWWGAMMKFEKLIQIAERPTRADKSAVGAINRPLRLNKFIGLRMTKFMGLWTTRYDGQRASVGNVVSRLVGSKMSPAPQQPAMGFFTDTSLCIGCKACEVACKQWNQLPANEPGWTGASYDNTGQLSATTWRHVLFIEQIGRRDNGQDG